MSPYNLKLSILCSTTI